MKNSKLSVLPENCTWYLQDTDSYYDINFFEFPIFVFGQYLGWKNKSLPILLKIYTHDIFRVLIPIPDLDFWIFGPKIMYVCIYIYKYKWS